MENEKNKPTTYRAGSIKLLLWTNTNKDGNTSNSITFEKIYKDGETWKTTNSFNYRDLEHITALIEQVKKEKTPIEIKKPEQTKLDKAK